MQNIFYEYYGLSQKEFDKLWKDAIVVFDTNVLLSLYRLPLEARNEILAVMKEFQDRLWMPFQVGYEFHELRLDEANRPIDSLKGLTNKFSKFSEEIERDFSRNPYISNFKYVRDGLKSLQGRIEKKVKEWVAECPDMLREDTVLSELTTLYEGRVGEPYDEEKLKELYKEGQLRYEQCVPPGFKDKNKGTGERHKYGDLIIWYEILEKAKESNSDILFVTDDQKEDWWRIYKGDIIGPRLELIKEFRMRTNNHLLGFYTTARFLYYAKRKIGVTVKPKTMEEVKFPLEDWAKIWEQSSQPGQVSLSLTGAYPFISVEDSGKSELDMSSVYRMCGDKLRLSDIPIILDNDISSSVGETRRRSLFNTPPATGSLGSSDVLDSFSLNNQSSDGEKGIIEDNKTDNQTE